MDRQFYANVAQLGRGNRSRTYTVRVQIPSFAPILMATWVYTRIGTALALEASTFGGSSPPVATNFNV